MGSGATCGVRCRTRCRAPRGETHCAEPRVPRGAAGGVECGGTAEGEERSGAVGGAAWTAASWADQCVGGAEQSAVAHAWVGQSVAAPREGRSVVALWAEQRAGRAERSVAVTAPK
ncbi:hypothetical protein GUJ93_ZPchr0013g35862 [Zizania palustris]|uniref:Uncharacterized protein n=1 Tax=Zizania palustris TaxID=103762 RepID=A0A8J6C4Z9_ZIZPA|nr:hypothetical protein GUJ93_ZPchr0013g35862 [Zizania palustris]